MNNIVLILLCKFIKLNAMIIFYALFILHTIIKKLDVHCEVLYTLSP